jgi:tRNA-(MS[2]IO[6]A)-hydroxylase (MiaE)-like
LAFVANWFSRSARRIEVPRLRSRSDEQSTTKIDLHEFTPPLREFLGRAAYVQLTIFENLSRTLAGAPTTAGKVAIGHAAELSITRHRALADEIVRDGGVVSAAMEPYVAQVDEFERVTRGSDWFENLVTCYLTAGFLDDFYERLAVGLAPETTKRIATIYESDAGEVLLAEQLQIAITESPRLASRLAMWGRRLVGDTMLVARAALNFTADHTSDEARVEPVFTELIAAHTRRMDFLGLTA